MTVITHDFNCLHTIITDCNRETSILIHLDKTTVSEKTKFFKRLHVADQLYRERLAMLIRYVDASRVDHREKRVVDTVRSLTRLRVTLDSYISLYEYSSLKQVIPVDDVVTIISANDKYIVDLIMKKKAELHLMEYIIFLTWIVDAANPRINYILHTNESSKIFEI